MRRFRSRRSLWWGLVLAGCAAGGSPFDVPSLGLATPWTRLEKLRGPEEFSFAVVADRCGGCRKGVFARAIDRVNLLGPEFVTCVGDLVKGDSEDAGVISAQYDEIDALVNRLEMPFFYVAGNHDITNAVMADMYRSRYGTPYYHFLYKNVLFVVVCTEDPPGSNISDEQVGYVRAALAENPDVRWTFVFMHKPLFLERGGILHEGWARIEEALRGRPHTVFGGHDHTYVRREKEGQSYIQLATTGGTSALAGPRFGQFDHFAWVTVTDDGVRVANLALDGIFDEYVTTPESLALYRSLLHGTTVSTDVMFAGEDAFSARDVLLRLTNGTKMPARVSGRLAANATLRATPDTFEARLPAESAHAIPLRLEAAAGVAIDAIEPLTLEWTSVYRPDEGEPVEVEGSRRIGLARRFDCPRAAGPVAVDGKLDDWESLPFDVRKPGQVCHDPSTHEGPDDCRFRFGVAWDDDYLYVAVEVTDDAPFYDANRHVWMQDGIEIRVHAGPEPGRSRSRGQGEWEELLPILVAPGESPGAEVFWERQRIPEGVKVVCARTATGHVTEVAVPASYLDDRQGGQWREFRFNVAVDDFDVPEKGAQLWWRPDWRRGEAIDGSGTFRRR